MEERETLILELRLIQQAVNEASEHTKRQLEAIDTSLSLEAFISILAAIGIAYLLKISLYWIPAAFLLIIIWGVYALSTLILSQMKTIEQSIDNFSKLNPIHTSASIEFVFKNIIPFMKAFSILYLISLIIILAILPPWFKERDILTYLPIFACLIFLIIPLKVDNLRTSFQLGNIDKIIKDVKSGQELGEISVIKKFALGVLMLFAAAVVIFLIILPFISLAITYPVAIPLIENVRFLILVLLLQIVAMIMMARYFNAMAVQKELTNALTNYADIHAIVQYFSLGNQFERRDVDRVKHLFLTAKHFDIIVDDSMRLFNFYLLVPHRISIREIATFGEPVLKDQFQGSQ